MPRIGIMELLIVLLVAIVFINPKDFPRLFRTIGGIYRQAKDLRDNLAGSFRRFSVDPKQRPENGGKANQKARAKPAPEDKDTKEAAAQ